MGRYKEFDAALVLHKAMKVFGQYGYEGASLQDLLKATGIARQSWTLLSALEDKNAKVIARLESPG